MLADAGRFVTIENSKITPGHNNGLDGAYHPHATANKMSNYEKNKKGYI